MAERIRAAFLSGYLDLAEELGGDPAKLLRALGITRQALLGGDQILDQRAASQLLERSAATFACPDFGLRLVARQDLSIIGPLALAMRNCASLGDAFHDLARYLIVFGSAPRVRVEKLPKSKDILIRTELWMQSSGSYPQTMELFVGAMVRILQILSEGRAHPKAIFFQHPVISRREIYRRALLGPVTFSHGLSGLVISFADWSRAVEGGDSEVHKIARAYLDQQLTSGAADLAAQVRRLVATLLASGRCSRQEIAETLNIHPRTLVRRLAEGAASFEGLVEQERAALAERLLAEKRIPLGQVAALLGYSEQSSFTRSCRRWFNESPSSARRRLCIG